MKNKKIISILFLLVSMVMQALPQDSIKVHYDFENDSANWKADAPLLWNVNGEKASSGERSLSYTVNKNDLLPTSKAAMYSIETGYTIMQVRTMQADDETLLLGTSYEGTVVCFNYDGIKLWENKLSGYMNHDIACADIDNDGKDEVLAANANGTLYCLDDDGRSLWKFRKNEAPMNTATLVEDNGTKYIACGGFDCNVYYLTVDGQMIKRFHSTTYSVDKQGGITDHHMNFMRTVKQNGKDVLVLHSSVNTNWAQGTLYFFNAMETQPFKHIQITACNSQVYGTFAINDLIDDSTEILLGANGLSSLNVASATIETGLNRKVDTKTKSSDFSPAGYRMASAEAIPDGESFKYYIAYGNRMIIVSPDPAQTRAEVITGTFAYNGMCKDATNNKLLLASVQSGGSCIHIIDYTNNEWKDMYRDLTPPGKMTEILENTSDFRSALNGFIKPAWEREQIELLVMSGGASDAVESEIASINPVCPKFIRGAGIYPHVENWDRSGIENEVYREKRDERKSYDYTSEQCVNTFKSALSNADHGIEFWAGHGSDPMYYSLNTYQQTMPQTNGKTLITVFAELESHDENLHWMMDNYMYPMAELFKQHNGLISVRNKHLFWQNIVHTDSWKRVVDGDFADVFVSSMEESNSKTMDMSTSGRMGLWAAGAMNRWGARFTRDNVCYDRLRQISYQRIPNHSLRMFVWNIASGASVIHNTSVNDEYTNILWYMLAKGILFMPKREEIVSFNPIHLSMLDPDPLYIEGNSVKVTTGYSESFEKANPMVVSHLSGSWPGAPVKDWDFSKYATGGNERRLEFLPPYPNGMVLTTPPNDATSARGIITDHLHPMYKEIMEEVFTDGRNYYDNKDKTGIHKADVYGPTITQKVKDAAKKLPLTVEGRVAWVTAQTAPLHLRLTLVDGGYVNPDDRKATITFHTAKVKSITNLINGETIEFSGNKATVEVPCGLWTFLDIELTEEL